MYNLDDLFQWINGMMNSRKKIRRRHLKSKAAFYQRSTSDSTVSRPGLQRPFSDLRRMHDDDSTILGFQHQSPPESMCSVVGLPHL